MSHELRTTLEDAENPKLKLGYLYQYAPYESKLAVEVEPVVEKILEVPYAPRTKVEGEDESIAPTKYEVAPEHAESAVDVVGVAYVAE